MFLGIRKKDTGPVMSKTTPNGIPSPIRIYLLILPEQFHYLVTNHSNTWCIRGVFIQATTIWKLTVTSFCSPFLTLSGWFSNIKNKEQTNRNERHK